MQIRSTLFVLVAALLWMPSALIADRASVPAPDSQPSRAVLPPVSPSVLSLNAGAFNVPPSLTLDLSARRASDGGAPVSGLGAQDNDGGSKQSYLPVLYSLLIPGTGEIAMGYPKRGVALIALEATAWIGYFHYHDEGLDGRAEFEAFADAHWDYDRWIIDHPAVEALPVQERTFDTLDAIGQSTWGTNWPGYHSYASKEEAELNYYENIGKYDWFISGWEDWDPVGKPHNTSLRTEYRAMRKQSNDDLDTAEQFVFLSIATRVFSLIETVYLARKRSDSTEGSNDSSERKYSITTRSKSLTSGEVAFVYRF